MKIKSVSLPFFFTVLFVFGFSCTPETDNPDYDFFLPNFSNRWTCENNRNPGSLFFFNIESHNDTTGSGNFTGTENSNGITYFVNGSYKYKSVQLHYLSQIENSNLDNGPDEGLTFTGLLDTTHPLLIMRMVNTAKKGDSLVLLQHN